MDIRNREYRLTQSRFLTPLFEKDPAKVNNLWIRGEKGVGKSILLKKIAYELYHRQDILMFYVKVPAEGLDLGGIYRRCIGWVGHERFDNLSARIYSEFFNEMTTDDAAKVFEVPSDMLKSLARAFGEIVKKNPEVTFDIFSKDLDRRKKLQKLRIEPDQIRLNALKRLVAAKLVARHRVIKKFADLISGYPENPYESFARVQNVTSKLSVPMLLSFFWVAQHFLRTRAVVIILDEFEVAWREMSDKAKLLFVVALRAIHDSSQGNVKFILTTTDEVLELLATPKFRHLLDVIPRTSVGMNIVDVPKLDDSQVQLLVAFRLGLEGVRSRPGNFIDPFVPEVLVAVNRRVNGVTRLVIQELRDIVDAAEELQKKVIDKETLLAINPTFSKYL
jgi:hypothetical protein